MSKGSTLFISPHFPPYKSGLSDYSFQFTEELKKHSKLEILVGSEADDWKGLKLLQRFMKIIQSDAETVLIQYVPYMYGSRGMNLQFPLLIFLYYLFNKKKIELMVHEYNYPSLGDLKSFLLCRVHLLMGKILLLASDQVFCSTEHFVRFLTPKSLSRVELLAVGSNILKKDLSDHKLRELGLKKGEYVCLFGGFHPSKDQEFILSELSRIDYKVVHIGTSEADYKGLSHLDSDEIIKTGFIPPSEVGELLSNCKVLLTYFNDGATLRRGSLMAGVELGCQVLSNSSENTEEPLLNCKNIRFAKNQREYRKELNALLEGAYRHFDQENPFSWGQIIQQYLLHRIGR